MTNVIQQVRDLVIANGGDLNVDDLVFEVTNQTALTTEVLVTYPHGGTNTYVMVDRDALVEAAVAGIKTGDVTCSYCPASFLGGDDDEDAIQLDGVVGGVYAYGVEGRAFLYLDSDREYIAALGRRLRETLNEDEIANLINIELLEVRGWKGEP